MKIFMLILPVFALFFSSCGLAHKIDQSTQDIERNTAAVERSTEAIHRNLKELDKAAAS